MQLLTKLSLVLLALGKVLAGQVLLHDPSQTFISGAKEQQLQHQHVTSLVCAACKLTPPYSDPLPDEAQSLLSNDLFNGPKALVVLSVAGTPNGDTSMQQLQEALQGGHSVSVEVLDTQSSPFQAAGAMVGALEDIAVANPDVQVRSLDHTALKGCGNSCLMSHLSLAAAAMGGKVEGDSMSASTLHLPEGGVLDLGHKAHRLMALEMAGFMGSLQQQLEDEKESEDLDMYEGTFVGLQGLAAVHGQEDPLVAQAWSGVLSLVQQAKQQLEARYGKEVLYQVSLVGDAPVPSAKPAHLLMWKEASRRRLMAAGPSAAATRRLEAAADEAAASKKFARKAAAYGGFLIVLYFTFAAVYCLVNMPFKQDTLLYGRSKAD